MNGPFDLAKCKLIVDTIYELTKDGYDGKLGIDNHTSAVSRLLQKRGILKRTGSFRFPCYKWVAAMSPTDVLYKNILSDYTDIIIQPERKKKSAELPPPFQDHQICRLTQNRLRGMSLRGFRPSNFGMNSRGAALK